MAVTGKLWGLWGHRGGSWPDVGVREGFLAEVTAACSPSLASGTQLTPWPWSQPPDPWKQAAPISAGTWDGGDSGGGGRSRFPRAHPPAQMFRACLPEGGTHTLWSGRPGCPPCQGHPTRSYGHYGLSPSPPLRISTKEPWITTLGFLGKLKG